MDPQNIAGFHNGQHPRGKDLINFLVSVERVFVKFYDRWEVVKQGPYSGVAKSVVIPVVDACFNESGLDLKLTLAAGFCLVSLPTGLRKIGGPNPEG